VRKADVLKTLDQKNYDLIIKNLLDNKVKSICVNTSSESYCDDENNLNQWWIDNESSFTSRDKFMKFDGGVSGCCAQTSRNKKLDELYKLYSTRTYKDIWEALDKYKSDTPTGPRGGLGSIFKSVWNNICEYLFLPINLQYFNLDIKRHLIESNFPEDKAHAVARMVEESL